MSEYPKPGPGLDALVAERVMGWRTDKISDRMWRVNEGDCWTRPKDGFAPSTSISAAWEVVEKMKTHKGSGWFNLYWDDDNEEWMAGWWQYDEWLLHDKAPTAPHAICLAALKAVEAQP